MTGPLSEALFARAREVFPGGVNSPVRSFRSVGGDPFIVKKGEGPYLVDVDGTRYVDYVLSWGPLVFGHAYPRVVEALRQQLERGTSFGACCEEEQILAGLVMDLVPSIEMIRFVNSGTEASMTGVRLARGYTDRDLIVKFSGCYHGHVDTLLAKAGSGLATLALPDSLGVPSGVTGTTLVARFNDIEAVEQLFTLYGDQIAAVFIEPVVGNSGLVLPKPGFLERLRTLTAAHGALLVFDEVMTGFRVSLNGAQGKYGVVPDLTLLGKVIGGGLPVGAIGGRRAIMEKLAPLGAVYQAGTLSGNPLAMIAGAETLRAWKEPGVFESTAGVATTLTKELSSLCSEKGIPITASTAGTMFGFFFHPGPVTCYEEALESDREFFKQFFHAMLGRGIYFAPSPFEAGFVSALHNGEPLARTLEELRKFFGSI